MKKRWTDEEIDFLFKYCGVLPIALLVKKFNKTFKTNRTSHAITSKIWRLGLTHKVEIDYLTKTQWAKTFGFNNGHIMTRWERKGLKVVKLNQYQHAISIKAMAKFANERPHLFTSIDQEILLYYFDEELVNKINQSKSYTYSAKKIKTSDGRTFDSQTQASQQLRLSQRSIAREIKRPDGWLQLV